jgi:hypothetical protein
MPLPSPSSSHTDILYNLLLEHIHARFSSFFLHQLRRFESAEDIRELQS